MIRWYVIKEYNRTNNDQVPRESFMVNDIKTLRGIKKRYIKDKSILTSYIIKQCINDKYYEDKSWRVVETYQKDHGIALTMTTALTKKEAI